MKRTIFHMIRNLLICASLVAGSWPAVAAAATQKVAVVPFTVYAEKDLAFLQKGIVDMLTSRLSQPGEVAVIGREATASALEAVDGPLNPESAVALGKKLGVDYVLFGSLTVFGESVSVDAKMLDVAGSKPPLSFYTQSASYGEVIPAIDRFAAQINEEVFGRKPVRAAAPAAAPAVAPAPAPAPEVPDTRTHPEKLIESGFGETEEGRTAVAGIEMGRPWKSRRFRELINGMDLGDVDADGRIETVLAATDKILIYRWENGRFLETARIEMPAFRSAIGVDVGDINGNGVEEIFVTALNNQKNSVQSIVYEFSGSGYQPIVETSSWYFRIVEQKAFGKRLFGQRQKIGKGPSSMPIYEMTWEGGDYVSQNRVLPGGKANLLGFASGKITDAEEDTSLVYSPKDRLQILDAVGKEIWTGSDQFGGSTQFLLLPVDSPGMVENRSFFPMRIRVRDINGEGTDEVIVAQNEEAVGRHLASRRIYTKTQIDVLSWDGLGLATIWKTRTLSGHIGDLAVGDFDGDGIDELVAVLVEKEGSVIGMEARCALIAFDILPSANRK